MMDSTEELARQHRDEQDRALLNVDLPISGNDSDDDLVAKLVRLFTKRGYNTHQDLEVLDSARAMLHKAGGKSLADRVAPLVRRRFMWGPKS
jgi:RecA-family ATPase